ncbi:aquaporin-10 isoform 1-T1 [Ara ararauna]
MGASSAEPGEPRGLCSYQGHPAVPGPTQDSGPCEASPCAVAPIGVKSALYHPLPAPGLIKSGWERAQHHRCRCLLLASPMGTTSFLGSAWALLHIQNQLVRECLAEMLAVLVLILITLSGSAQMVTSSESKGNILTAYLAGALAVMVSIYIAGGVSGAHLNPAFSLAMCLVEQFPWWKLPIFVAVQTLGAFISAGAVYAVYHDAIHHYSNGTLTASCPRETASIFATYPADYLSLSNGFLDQVVATAVLIVGILAITDTRNKGVPKGLEPVAVALLVLSLEVSMGSNCGCPMNPARDFGPRLFTYVAGWGTEVFSRDNGWWWVPVVAPMLGAAVGSALYQLLVAFHHPLSEGATAAEESPPVLSSAAVPADPETSLAEETGGTLPQK